MASHKQLRDAFFATFQQRYPDAIREESFNFLRPRSALSNYPELLNPVAKALEKHGRFSRNEFLPTDRTLHCDIFIPKKKLIIEIDERQHFTKLRALSLKAYPASARVDFSIDEWIQRSLSMDVKDNDPPYRDEQRAFLDAMRDLLLPIHGFKPVRRVFIKDLESTV